MSKVAIDKEINLSQFIGELEAATGETGIGLRRVWDGVAGYVEAIGQQVSELDLQTAVDAHVAGPPIPPVEPPNPNQDILDDIEKLAADPSKAILLKIVGRL